MKKIGLATLTIAFFFVFLRWEEVSSKLPDRLVECFRQGQYHEVIRLTEKRFHSGDEDVLVLRALAFLKTQEKERAYPLILELSRRSSPFLLDHLYYLYLEQLIQEKNIEEISFWIQHMEERFPDSPLLSRALTITARAFLRLKLPQQALSVVLRLFSLSLFAEEKGDALLLLAQALQALDRSQEAVWILKKVYQDFPQRTSEIKSVLRSTVSTLRLDLLPPREKISFLQFFFALGFTEETKALFSQVVTDDLSPSLVREFLVLRLRVALRLNALGELETILTQEEKQDTEEVLFYRGVLAERRERYTEAISFYRQLLHLFPQSAYRVDA